jgi:hypothetical protein
MSLANLVADRARARSDEDFDQPNRHVNLDGGLAPASERRHRPRNDHGVSELDVVARIPVGINRCSRHMAACSLKHLHRRFIVVPDIKVRP